MKLDIIMENHEIRRNNENILKKSDFTPILPQFYTISPRFFEILAIFLNSITFEPLVVEICMTT